MATPTNQYLVPILIKTEPGLGSATPFVLVHASTVDNNLIVPVIPVQKPPDTSDLREESSSHGDLPDFLPAVRVKGKVCAATSSIPIAPSTSSASQKPTKRFRPLLPAPPKSPSPLFLSPADRYAKTKEKIRTASRLRMRLRRMRMTQAEKRATTLQKRFWRARQNEEQRQKDRERIRLRRQNFTPEQREVERVQSCIRTRRRRAEAKRLYEELKKDCESEGAYERTVTSKFMADQNLEQEQFEPTEERKRLLLHLEAKRKAIAARRRFRRWHMTEAQREAEREKARLRMFRRRREVDEKLPEEGIAQVRPSVNDNGQTSSDNAMPAPVKRKRGRPRKYPLPEEGVGTSGTNRPTIRSQTSGKQNEIAKEDDDLSAESEAAIMDYCQRAKAFSFEYSRAAQCTICRRPLSLWTLTDTLEHCLLHGVVQIYKCQHCPSQQKTISYMRSHLRRVHGLVNMTESDYKKVIGRHQSLIKEAICACLGIEEVEPEESSQDQPSTSGATPPTFRALKQLKREFSALPPKPRNDRTSLISYCKTALIKAAWIESPVACKICGVEMMSLSADFLLFKKDGGTVAAPCPFTALRHVMTHLENPVFDCGFCLYQCKDISAMRSHLSSRHNRKSHNDLDFTDKTNGYRNEILNLIDQCFKPTDNRTGTSHSTTSSRDSHSVLPAITVKEEFIDDHANA